MTREFSNLWSTLKRVPVLPLIACSLFVLAGLAFLPLLGIESDEALFATVFFRPRGGVYVYRIGHWELPLMILSYLGTFKSWLYRPIFKLFGMGTATVRIPAILAGAASIWLLYQLLERISGRRAACLGSALLATDAAFLLTTTFDWGPIALEHLLVLGGVLLLVRFWDRRNDAALAGAFFLFGLALWNKALAIWILSAVGAAALLTLPRQILDVATPRRLGLAALCLCLGALPLVLYNIHTRGGTLRGNAVYDSGSLRLKAQTLATTLDGSGLFDDMVPQDWQTPHPHEPSGWLPRASAVLSVAAEHPRHSLLLYAFCLSLLLTPLARGSALRALLFALVAMTVAWFEMALTANAGSGVHHTILLWPLPELIIAISFAEASLRLRRAGIPIVAGLSILLVASNLVLVNEYYTRMWRNRGTVAWTDAVFRLSDYMKTVPAKAVFSLDWGFLDTLRLLSRGALPMRVGEDPIGRPQLTADNWKTVLDMISTPENVFIAHGKGLEFYPGLAAKMTQFAEGAGYRREDLTTLFDSTGRPTFEVFRFVKQ
jgi:4-amino-4-deoxy-L-arabinose transferase-like glycosyltransferase